MEITDIIQQHPVYIAIALFFAAIGLAIKTFKETLLFYEDFVVFRNLKRLEALSKTLKDNSSILEYIEKEKESEVFRLASGINASGQEAELLIQLHKDGYTNKKQLKKIHSYIECDKNKKISIIIPISQQFLIAYSFISASYIFIIGLVAGIPIMLNNTNSQVFIGALVVIICALVSRFLSTEFRTYRMLLYLSNKLRDAGKLSVDNHWTKMSWKKLIGIFRIKTENS